MWFILPRGPKVSSGGMVHIPPKPRRVGALDEIHCILGVTLRERLKIHCILEVNLRERPKIHCILGVSENLSVEIHLLQALISPHARFCKMHSGEECTILQEF